VDVVSLLLVLGVLALFALIVSLMIWSEKKRNQDREQVARSLGFRPLIELESGTAARLIRLHQHSNSQEIQVHHPAERWEGDARILLFDLVDYGGDSTSTLVDCGIAIFSPELELPRFSLMPRVAEEGRLAEIANRFLEVLIKQRRNRIELKKNTHFDERYFLLGDDHLAIEAFLDEYRLSRLAQASYRHLEADRDCLTYSRFVFSTRSNRNRLAHLKEDLSEARVLLELLRNAS
jgi:hypothetical protein